MKITAILARLSETELHELARELEVDSEHISKGALASRIEEVVRSPRHIEREISTRRPPVLPLLIELLKSPDYTCPLHEVKQRATELSLELSRRVGSGELLGASEHALYRRVVIEAWRTDLSLDASEVSLLGVLRHELGMTQIQHFLTAHHPDVERFWRTGSPFDVVVDALRKAGVLFAVDDNLMLPEELVPRIRDAIGLQLNSDEYGRLLTYMSNSLLRDALKAFGAKSAGSKDARLERMIEQFIPVEELLKLVHISDLRSLCEEVGAKKSGSKEELIERLIGHFSEGLDLENEEDEEEEAPEVEAHVMERDAFISLFSSLKGRELNAIFWKLPELPSSGSKAKKVETLWSSHLNAESLLALLGGRALHDVLDRLGLKTSGSKAAKARRLVEYGNSQSEGGDSGSSSASHEHQPSNDTATSEVPPS